MGAIIELDEEANSAVERATAQANTLNHVEVATHDLLFGLAGGTDRTSQVLSSVGVTPAAVRTRIIESLPFGPMTRDGGTPLSSDVQNIIAEATVKRATRGETMGASTEEILLALLDNELRSETSSLARLGFDVHNLNNVVTTAFKQPREANSPIVGGGTAFLERSQGLTF